MSHVFFFSYASANRDRELERFFEDLCDETKVHTPYAARDPRLSFRDNKNLHLMVEWKPELLEALQTSSVLVCITSPGYFASRFCGQEYYVFEQRVRGAKENTRRLILPIIWAPTPIPPQGVFEDIQWRLGDFHDSYGSDGLRSLMKRNRREYARLVEAFAKAIGEIYNRHLYLPRASVVDAPSASQMIPNPFGGGEWDQCVTPQGWRSGPSVANFFFAASSIRHFVGSPKHGDEPSQWRPYHPTEAATIRDLCRRVAKNNAFYFRDIPLDQHREAEYLEAKRRKNLTLMVAEPAGTDYIAADLSFFDSDPDSSTAVLVPGSWPAPSHPDAVRIKNTFPTRFSLKKPPFFAPLESCADLEVSLAQTLVDLQNQVIRDEGVQREVTDFPPTSLHAGGK